MTIFPVKWVGEEISTKTVLERHFSNMPATSGKIEIRKEHVEIYKCTNYQNSRKTLHVTPFFSTKWLNYIWSWYFQLETFFSNNNRQLQVRSCTSVTIFVYYIYIFSYLYDEEVINRLCLNYVYCKFHLAKHFIESQIWMQWNEWMWQLYSS